MRALNEEHSTTEESGEQVLRCWKVPGWFRERCFLRWGSSLTCMTELRKITLKPWVEVLSGKSQKCVLKALV